MVSSNLQRTLLLLSCTFLSLICGTLYLYSSFSPQLAKQLSYTVSDASTIALVGTIGMATAGPAAGRVVDKTGYSLLYICGGFSIVTGYWGLKRQYDFGYSNIKLSAFLLYMVGAGSTFVCLPNIKCCAVTFPRMKGLATSMPLAMYGLSAMFFSTAASIFYPGDTSGFLGCIALLSLAMLLLCAPSIIAHDFKKMHNSSPPLSVLSHAMNISRSVTLGITPQLEDMADKTKKRLQSRNMQYLQHDAITVNISGKQLLRNNVFWMLCLITGLLAATGQMYIYSVGYMSKALYAHGVSKFLDPALSLHAALAALEPSIQANQQLQVGTISIANSLGRVIAGIVSDIVVKSFNMTRKLVLFLACTGMMAALLISMELTDPDLLVFDSLIMGLSYGLLYGCMPLIVGEAFGMENFSSNWGLVSIAPILPGVWLTTAFGRIFDANSQSMPSSEEHEFLSICSLGSKCYSSAYKLTFLVTLLAFAALCYLTFSKKLNQKPTSQPQSIELASISSESKL